jgi:zinc transporter ZupT
LAAILLSGERQARWLAPVSGVLLAGVAVFGLIPELGAAIGWGHTLVLAGGGYGFLWLLDRRGYPVCPSCSHGGKFAASLVIATTFHAFVDGWGMEATRGEARVGSAIAAAILLHKVPEGLALGTMLRMSTTTVMAGVGLLVLAEFPTLVGGVAGLYGTPGIWINYPLAVAAGTFLFLGLHAMAARK